MELGETLTITATITSNTYLATRSKNNSEVTIRVSPQGSPTLTLKRNTPRSPPPTLSLSATKTSTKPADMDTQPSSIPQDKVVMQGWAMVSTQQQVSWDIAWICTATLPIPKVSVMLESELSMKPCVPSQFEAIESIDELESLPSVNDADRTEPVKFEIKTKAGRTFKIITNNFMTNGLRRLKTTLATPETSSRSNSPSPNNKSVDSLNPKALLRANTPKPPSPAQDTHPSKPLLVRTSTPFPEGLQPVESAIARIARAMHQRSASFDVIPQTPSNVKPQPRPVSLNIHDLIKKNWDTPKLRDPRSFLKMHSTRSKIAKKPHFREVPIVTVKSIMEAREREQSQLRKCDEEYFSDCDDNASNFSEDMEDNSLKEKKAQATRNLLNCSDPEIRDLCERTKGLSPDINIVLRYESDSDSSCFSEDMDDNSIKEEDSPGPRGADECCSDNFSDCSAMSSNVSSGFFDGIPVGGHDATIRGLHKAMKKSESKQFDKDEARKTIKMEKTERKKKEKEAREAARMSKRMERSAKEKKEKHTSVSHSKTPINVRMKSLLKLFGV